MNTAAHKRVLEGIAVECKRTQAVLDQKRNFTSAVLDTVGALVVVLDQKGRIVHFNQDCEQTTGYSFDEVRGKYFWDLFLIPAEVVTVKAVFENLRLDKLPNQYENYWVTRSGEHRLISWSNTVLLNSDGVVE